MNIRTLLDPPGGAPPANNGNVPNNGVRPFQGRGERLGGDNRGNAPAANRNPVQGRNENPIRGRNAKPNQVLRPGLNQAGGRAAGAGGRAAGAGGRVAGGAFQAGYAIGNFVGEMMAPDVTGPQVSASGRSVYEAVRAVYSSSSSHLVNRDPFVSSSSSFNDNRNQEFVDQRSARNAALLDARVPADARPLTVDKPPKSRNYAKPNTPIRYPRVGGEDRVPIGTVEIYRCQTTFFTSNGESTQYIALQYHLDGHANESVSHIHIRPAFLRIDEEGEEFYEVEDNGYLYNDMNDAFPIKYHYYIRR